jgi:molybdopterin molybdotransferase
MISVLEAHAIIMSSTNVASRTETVSLAGLPGRVVAEDIFAEFPMPRFTNAAMDGFAVMHDDIAGSSASRPARLPVVQEIPAGKQSTERLEPGTCAQIMTGAPLPNGADTVVPFEDTSGFGRQEVEFFKASKPGANIRRAGEEVARGELIVPKGTRATPAETGLLAAFGLPAIAAFRRPRVSILTVGDELRLPGEPAGPLAIYNSNLPLLEACALAAGAEVVEALQLPDDPAGIMEATRRSLETCDLLVTAGGISSGQYDFMHETLTALDVVEKFWKVAQKPGKPLYFGSAPSGALVFSLPGNPVSALACFIEYALPCLARMQGCEPPPKLQVCLEEPFPADMKRHRFLFGRLRSESGRLLCSLSPKTESHMLTTARGANCIVESAPAPAPLPAGSMVTCNPLPWAGYC